jgi:hypothetical protein
VVAALKLPARLDTTESGFYTLSDPTKEYLAALTQPVTAYTTIPDDSDRVSADIHRLLDAASAVNPTKFQVRTLNPVLNKNDITSLRSKYPQVDFDQYGVLLTTGQDEKQYAFIRMSEFAAGTTFRGESVLAKELLGLSEGKTKPVVYFTQSSGELALGSAAAAPDAADPKRSGAQLKLALENGFAEVKPWASTPGSDAKVPDDATVVVVADPLRPLPPAQAEAIKQFVTTPRDGKKGKLVVLAGAHANLDGSMTGTGLEELLAAEFKVRLRPDFVYGEPISIAQPDTAVVGVPRKLVTARNTLALALNDYQVLPMANVRLVEPIAAGTPPGAPPAGTTADPLLVTIADRATWLEPAKVDPIKVLNDLRRSPTREAMAQALARMQLSETPRPVAAIASEGQAARAVVVGSGEFFSDYSNQRLGGGGAPGEVLAAAVNWLRDRPAVANIANKTYGTYSLAADFDGSRGLWLPLAGVPLLVAAAGLGVWVSRRS